MAQKISQIDHDLINQLYAQGKWTRPLLAQKFNVSVRTIDYHLRGTNKPFATHDVYDLPTSKRVSLNEAIIVDKQEEKAYSGIKHTCPQCNKQLTVGLLLRHLVRKHHRYDLEYLLHG